jgi:hypothetical protein
MGLYQTIAEPLYAGQYRRRSLRKAAERLVELLLTKKAPCHRAL